MQTLFTANFPGLGNNKVALVQGLLTVKNGKVILSRAEKVAEMPVTSDIYVVHVDEVHTN